jgi:hypothetical protein
VKSREADADDFAASLRRDIAERTVWLYSNQERLAPEVSPSNSNPYTAQALSARATRTPKGFFPSIPYLAVGRRRPEGEQILSPCGIPAPETGKATVGFREPRKRNFTSPPEIGTCSL